MTDSIDKILEQRAEKQARDIVATPYGAFEKEIAKIGKLASWLTISGRKITVQMLIREFREERIKIVAADIHQKLSAEFVRKVDALDPDSPAYKKPDDGT